MYGLFSKSIFRDNKRKARKIKGQKTETAKRPVGEMAQQASLLFLSLGIALKITLLEFQALYILFLQQKN
jgi:hypothetical protein